MEKKTPHYTLQCIQDDVNGWEPWRLPKVRWMVGACWG